MTKRVAGVQSGEISSLSAPMTPPAHDPRKWVSTETELETHAEAFGRHFLRCFFCHIGDRYTEDHFCETGRELIVAMLDELVAP